MKKIYTCNYCCLLDEDFEISSRAGIGLSPLQIQEYDNTHEFAQDIISWYIANFLKMTPKTWQERESWLNLHHKQMKSFEDQYQKNNNDGMAYNDSDHSSTNVGWPSTGFTPSMFQKMAREEM